MARIISSDDDCDVIRKTVGRVERENSDASELLKKLWR